MASNMVAHNVEKSSEEGLQPSRETEVVDTSIASSVRQRRHQQQSPSDQRTYVERQPQSSLPRSPASSIYLGSYGHGATSRTRSRFRVSDSPVPRSPRTSTTGANMGSIGQDLEQELEDYGVEELRDGFFDANFQKARETNHESLEKPDHVLQSKRKNKRQLAFKSLISKKLSDLRNVLNLITTTRAGVKLGKSFLAFFIAYIICLLPSARQWLGRYSYVMVISAILNHPGRPIGAQIDGAIFTILGTATGLGWAALALWVSTSTSVARRGYGGILAASLVIFVAAISAIRSTYIRLFQFSQSAGLSILYTCLADTSFVVSWSKLFDYGIPWIFGQAICFIICCTVFPDAGSRPLAVTLHHSFKVMLQGFELPHRDDEVLHRKLADEFVALSVAYRDLVLDISIIRFQPSDVEVLRNLMQDVIRSLLAMKLNTDIVDHLIVMQHGHQYEQHDQTRRSSSSAPTTRSMGRDSMSGPEIIIEIDNPDSLGSQEKLQGEAFSFVAGKLRQPTTNLLLHSTDALARCDAVLMNMSGYRKYLGPPAAVSSDVEESLILLRQSLQVYDSEESLLLTNPELPLTYADHPEVVEIFLFVRPVRQAAGAVEALLKKVIELQLENRGWRLHLPSYPWSKALNRTNATVRHDRGGVTAGFFFHSQGRLKRAMKGVYNSYKPPPRNLKSSSAGDNPPVALLSHTPSVGKYQEEEDLAADPSSTATTQQKLRYRIWKVLHRLQGFESKFALKAVIVTALLAIPAWLPQSQRWWNINESWWTVVVAWLMLHPRVGGNFQDLLTRAFCAILGAVWGGFAYAADNGNPYIMALFAALYMIPMVYRYTQSTHPRSGIVGCLSFVVVSLGAKAADGHPSITQISWTRGVAFVVGIVAAVAVNWVLWPFVARHELRKALSAMLIYSSIIYRGVVAKYIYYGEGEEPGEADIARSEMLEGRLREGFVRIHQLLDLTKHEIRLRGPFDPTPHFSLITSLEQFFEYLVAIRQSSVFFHPHYLKMNDLNSTDPQSSVARALLSYRRDAVAAILMNLYILAGALRGGRKVPRYLPSAAAARRKLLQKMDEVEAEQAKKHEECAVIGGNPERVQTLGSQKWSQIYAYSYNQSLTGCVRELELLQKYTKEICGEQGFDSAEYLLPVDGLNDDEDSTGTAGLNGRRVDEGRHESQEQRG